MASEIKGYLAADKPKEVWQCLKGWYRSTTNWSPKPCYLMMEHLTAERMELYARDPPLGGAFPINNDPLPVPDELPTDGKIREGVRQLQNGQAAGVGKMRMEHLKEWLADILEEEKNGKEGMGQKWQLFVQLVTAIWERGSIPEQMTWMVIILLPKGGGGHRVIGLLEPCWKVMEPILVQWLLLIQFQDCLYGGISQKGTDMAMIKAKLVQQLAFLDQTPWHQIFLDLHKAYDTMDWEKTLDSLSCCSVDPRALQTIK